MTTPPPAALSAPTSPWAQWARDWRAPMLRFAQLHIQPREEAEDAVQDALAALLSTDPAVLAQADPKRYLFGILKHKITDRLRRKYRTEMSYNDAFGDDELDNTLFNARGHWVDGVAPATWTTPEEQLHSDQFFPVVDLCMQKLPPKPARVFSMKEFLDCETDEICATLGLSKPDYWQCMSRARKQIQLCLHQNWFEGASP